MKCIEEAIPPFSFHVTSTMETGTVDEALILSFKGVTGKSIQPCPPAKSQAGKVMRGSYTYVRAPPLHTAMKQLPFNTNGQS